MLHHLQRPTEKVYSNMQNNLTCGIIDFAQEVEEPPELQNARQQLTDMVIDSKEEKAEFTATNGRPVESRDSMLCGRR